MKQPIHSPVPCISGAHGIEISWLPPSTAVLTMSATSPASDGGATPSSGKPLAIRPAAMPPFAYITPLGMPVVPPV